MKPIGGFMDFSPYSWNFGAIQKPEQWNTSFTRKDKILTHSGRGALKKIIETLGIKKLTISDYDCPSIINMLKSIPIDIEIQTFGDYTSHEGYLLDAHYWFWSVKDEIESRSRIGDTITDLTHNIYHPGTENGYSFSSLRKWFPVPDGAFILPPERSYEITIPEKENHFSSTDHLIPLPDGSKSYYRYLNNEELIDSGYFKASKFTEQFFEPDLDDEGNDYKLQDLYLLGEIRKDNFLYLHEHLRDSNELVSTGIFEEPFSLRYPPFCYPYLPEKPIEREKLYKDNIFIPYLWKGSPCEVNSFSHTLVTQMLPLPIDQRLNRSDMERLLDAIKRLLS